MTYLYHDFLAHHGIKGQKWGIRRYQNDDGSLTEEGKKRYDRLTKTEKRLFFNETMGASHAKDNATREYHETRAQKLLEQTYDQRIGTVKSYMKAMKHYKRVQTLELLSIMSSSSWDPVGSIPDVMSRKAGRRFARDEIAEAKKSLKELSDQQARYSRSKHS